MTTIPLPPRDALEPILDELGDTGRLYANAIFTLSLDPEEFAASADVPLEELPGVHGDVMATLRRSFQDHYDDDALQSDAFVINIFRLLLLRDFRDQLPVERQLMEEPIFYPWIEQSGYTYSFSDAGAVLEPVEPPATELPGNVVTSQSARSVWKSAIAAGIAFFVLGTAGSYFYFTQEEYRSGGSGATDNREAAVTLSLAGQELSPGQVLELAANRPLLLWATQGQAELLSLRLLTSDGEQLLSLERPTQPVSLGQQQPLQAGRYVLTIAMSLDGDPAEETYRFRVE